MLTLGRARVASGELVDLIVDDGRIARRTPSAGAPVGITLPEWAAARFPTTAVVDLAGRLVVPPLVNGHVHLDKTLLGAAWYPHAGGSGVAARVAEERRLRGSAAPVSTRAGELADAMLRTGTGFARTHVDIDPDIGLASLEALLDLRSRLRGRLDLQIVAFPQSGMSGVGRLLADALRAGADVVGGLDPVGSGDLDGQLDLVFGLAERFGARIDIHSHDLGADGVRGYEAIALRTGVLGLGGRVVISHAYGLGSVPLAEARRIGALLAGAGVAVMTNGPAGPMPPVLALRAEGVTVFSGTDNVRDAWWPYGDGDMLGIARQVAYQSGFLRDDELAVAFELASTSAASALGIEVGLLREGDAADLLVLEAAGPAAAVAAPPASRLLLRGGAVVGASDPTIPPARPWSTAM